MRRFRTSYLVWAAFAGCAFAALGFFELSGGMAKSEGRFWFRCGYLMRGEWADMKFERRAVTYQGIMLAFPAIALGWVMQAIVSVVLGKSANSVSSRS
jgi:hypothetical protein